MSSTFCFFLWLSSEDFASSFLFSLFASAERLPSSDESKRAESCFSFSRFLFLLLRFLFFLCFFFSVISSSVQPKKKMRTSCRRIIFTSDIDYCCWRNFFVCITSASFGPFYFYLCFICCLLLSMDVSFHLHEKSASGTLINTLVSTTLDRLWQFSPSCSLHTSPKFSLLKIHGLFPQTERKLVLWW